EEGAGGNAPALVVAHAAVLGLVEAVLNLVDGQRAGCGSTIASGNETVVQALGQGEKVVFVQIGGRRGGILVDDGRLQAVVFLHTKAGQIEVVVISVNDTGIVFNPVVRHAVAVGVHLAPVIAIFFFAQVVILVVIF